MFLCGRARVRTKEAWPELISSKAHVALVFLSEGSCEGHVIFNMSQYQSDSNISLNLSFKMLEKASEATQTENNSELAPPRLD